jgi:hypothetical protein
MKPAVLAGLAAAFAVLGQRSESPMLKPKPKPASIPPAAADRHERELATLAPHFRQAVERVIATMRGLGWDAIVHEGLRSAARARQLAEAGTGIFPSLHQYGLAADVTSRSRGWAVPEGFWGDLQSAAIAEGLTSGRRWSAPDPAHVQAVSVREQRAAMRWSVTVRDTQMRERFG